MLIANCNICQEILGAAFSAHGPEYENIVREGNNVLAQTENLLVIPSIGPLNDSHVMIVPKTHCNSFGALPTACNDEKFALIKSLREHYFSHFNKELLFFESGAGTLINHSGGCIFHAHIHVVEAQELFHTRLLAEVKLIEISAGNPTSPDLNLGYIWYMNAEGHQYLCNNPMLPSQFLRYTYAQCAGHETMWNWRRHSNIAGVKKALETYRNLKVLPASAAPL